MRKSYKLSVISFLICLLFVFIAATIAIYITRNATGEPNRILTCFVSAVFLITSINYIAKWHEPIETWLRNKYLK
jgi:nucleoside recognition membrane protein YjiH